jgi:hypothetical protein
MRNQDSGGVEIMIYHIICGWRKELYWNEKQSNQSVQN